jgi:hypothetical protein
MANFPIITWQVPLPEFQVNVAGTGALADAWGFQLNNVNGAASATSIAGVFAATVAAMTGQTATAVYNFTDGVGPAMGPLTYSTTITGAPILIDFDTLADAAVFGFDSLSFVITTAAAETTAYNNAGVWMPNGVSGDVTRTTRQRAASSSSEMSGLSTDVVNWGEVVDIEVRSTLFPVANAFRWYATQQIYATKAGRSLNDPNNIFEKMLAAAATGVTFRIYEQATSNGPGTRNNTPLAAKMPGISGKSAATDFLQADDEPRLWSASGVFFRGET